MLTCFRSLHNYLKTRVIDLIPTTQSITYKHSYRNKMNQASILLNRKT